MSEKSTIRCYLINGDSNAQVEAEIDLNKPFNVNIIVVAKRIPDFRREFISPEDRFHYLESDALKREFLDTIEVGAVVGDELIELDCNMTVANAWKKVLKGVPLEDGQEFAVLVNEYSRNKNDEMLVPVNEEGGIVNQEMANKLIEDNKALLEDKKSLQADKKLLLEEKKILTRERADLLEERKSLAKENKNLNGEIVSLRKKMDEIRAANAKLAKRPGGGRTAVYLLAGLIVGLVLGVLGFALFVNTNSHENQSVAVESAEISKENTQLKAENAELQKNCDKLEEEVSEAQKKYDTMVEEKDAIIADLQAKIDKYEADGGAGVPGVESADKSADSEAAGESRASEGSEASGGSESGEGVESSEAAGSSEGTESSEGAEASGSGSEMKVDSSLIMDADKWVEIISEEDGSGKTVKYSAVSEYKDGVIVSFAQGNRSSFSLAVPEGYTTFSFDIGHIMDSGKFNIDLKILVDGVVREDVGGSVKYTESPKHFDVTGLKAGQVITFDFDSDTYYVGETCKYGITNMVMHGSVVNGQPL